MQIDVLPNPLGDEAAGVIEMLGEGFATASSGRSPIADRSEGEGRAPSPSGSTISPKPVPDCVFPKQGQGNGFMGTLGSREYAKFRDSVLDVCVLSCASVAKVSCTTLTF
jgi:hypothetical protein